MFDEQREKICDWYGYSASVSLILEQFEKEAGYRFRPEYTSLTRVITTTSTVCQQGVQRFSGIPAQEVAKIAKEMMVDYP